MLHHIHFVQLSHLVATNNACAAWRRVRSIEVIQPVSALPQTGKANVIWGLLKVLKIFMRVSQFKVDPKRLSTPTMLFILPLNDAMCHRHVKSEENYTPNILSLLTTGRTDVPMIKGWLNTAFLRTYGLMSMEKHLLELIKRQCDIDQFDRQFNNNNCIDWIASLEIEPLVTSVTSSA